MWRLILLNSEIQQHVHRDISGLRRATVFVGALLFIVACGRSEIPAPDRLGGLRLSNVLRGSKAAELINALHRTPISAEEHLVALYQGNGEATLYVSRFATEDEARSLFDSMVQRLADNPSPFGNHRSIKRRGKMLHSVTGLGQLHYTFVHANSVYWLAGDLPVADLAVNDLLAALQIGT
jgi:hypothetical protein